MGSVERMKNKCENCRHVQKCEEKIFCARYEYPFRSVGNKQHKSRDLCAGCINDGFNYGRLKEETLNEAGCEFLKKAKVVLQSAPRSQDQIQPWLLKWRLNCYQRDWELKKNVVDYEQSKKKRRTT